MQIDGVHALLFDRLDKQANEHRLADPLFTGDQCEVGLLVEEPQAGLTLLEAFITNDRLQGWFFREGVRGHFEKSSQHSQFSDCCCSCHKMW